ncbi:protein TolR [Thalassotalea psychrophila]|uniref:Tol-Pal system protein TolR n=1 Tax=Thalassotalea psychrophila TaxID=3065647 RepID=A0ABY9TYI9_9GAMM|nr:protein TolR [Colwelliaceae bacterium SQ149]
MYVRVKRKRVAEINVVPYIDVMLVLLIIFMVTAPLVTQGVKVELPKADSEALSQDSKTPLVASVDIDGLFYLSVGDSKSEPLEPDELAVLVSARLEVEPDTPVVVNGDGNVPYNSIIQLMVLLQQSGVPSVGLMTESPEQ